MPKFLAAIPKGLGVTVHAVPTESRRRVYDDSIRNVTFTATDRMPDRELRHNKNDIDKFLTELSTVDSRIKILNDRVTVKDQPDLIARPFVKVETMLDHPDLVNDPDMQKHLKNAKNVREQAVTEGWLQEQEHIYENMKRDFIATKFKRKDLKKAKARDPETNENIYYVKSGEI